MDKQEVVKKVRKLMKAQGTQLTKLGEVLGSRGGQQAKIDRANRFVHGYQKSVSLDEIRLLAKFFSKPEEYFLQTAGGFLREEKTAYGKMNPARIEKLSSREVEDLFQIIQKKHPRIFAGVKLANLDEKIKRMILKVFYRRIE